MLYLNVCPVLRKGLPILKLALIPLVFVLISSCNKNRGNDVSQEFVKLDAPLEEVLSKITLLIPSSENENGQRVEMTVGSTYTGKYVPPNPLGESDRIRYDFLKQHAVEGNRYIFVVVAYNTGGSGVFYYITAVDKSTLKSVDEIFLDDQPKIEQVVLTTPRTDTVSVTYIERLGAKHDPINTRQKHFVINQGQLQEVSR